MHTNERANPRTVVDTDDGADHLRNDKHVSEVGLDTLRLLSGESV